MERPLLGLIRESVVFVDDVKRLRATIAYLADYIEHLEEWIESKRELKELLDL